MSVFLILVLVFLGLNFWLVYRLWRALRGTGWIRVAACLLLMLLIIGFPTTYRADSTNPLMLFWLWAGAFWIAWFDYALLLTCTTDCFQLANKRFGWWPSLSPERPLVRYSACAAVAGVSLLICIIGWYNATQPVVREITLDLPARHVPQRTLTMAALSDIHLGRLVPAAHLDKLTALIAPHQPDIVLFMGDVIDDRVGLDPAATRAALQRLQPPLGIWGITGNHEYISGDIDSGLLFLQQSGIHMLRDGWAAPGGKLLLVGRDDYSSPRFTGQPRAALQDILQQIPAAERQLPLIILDHQPQHLDEAAQAGPALQLSGHTHKGQIWPFNWLVALAHENIYGLSHKGATQFWVSSGAGTWGPPVRTSGRSEVLLIRINFVPVSDPATAQN